jgi:NAD(P)-dependent dehydrogenase (short-subunit alcohol dehydrogenase family)
MVRDLTCRRILITGASSGIGRALAEQAALQGACVAAAARSTERLEELTRALAARGAEVLPVTADVTSAADRRRLLDTVVDRFGGLDVLVNNAGVGGWGHFATSSETLLRQIMEVNFFAPAELIRLAIPVLTQGKQPAIVNLASMCGRRGLPAWTEYSASKFALCGLTEALRGEMARFDIDVLLVLPGLTRTDLPRHLLRDEGRMKIDFDGGQPPAAVATRVLEALRRNRTETVVGRDAFWILGVNRFLPRLVDHVLTRRVHQLYAP